MADRFENGSTANDLAGLPDDPTVSGFDSTARGFYHGGDLRGIINRLDYIKALGTTAIWLTPSFKNRPVQPQDGSAGYHGCWITDFTQIDPHLGINAELAELVDKAHRAGMKVFFDIITNHTADIIQYPIADPGWRCGTPDRPGSIVTSTTVATASLPSSFSLMSVVERTFTFSPSSWCWCDAFNAPAPSAIPAASVSSARNVVVPPLSCAFHRLPGSSATRTIHRPDSTGSVQDSRLALLLGAAGGQEIR
jgi:Alpha amylase, catalytic domain